MRSFIVGFGIRDTEVRSNPSAAGHRNDVHLETSAHEPSGGLLTGVHGNLPETMGSRVTSAGTDPRLDEPTGQ